MVNHQLLGYLYGLGNLQILIYSSMNFPFMIYPICIYIYLIYIYIYIDEALECLTLQATWAQNTLARAGANIAGKDGWQKCLPTCSAKQFGQHVFQAFHALLP